MSSGKGGSFFGGFLIGGLIGAMAAFFLSQKSEKETLGGKLGDLISKGREAVREAIEEGKSAAARREVEIHGEPEEED